MFSNNNITLRVLAYGYKRRVSKSRIQEIAGTNEQCATSKNDILSLNANHCNSAACVKMLSYSKIKIRATAWMRSEKIYIC